MVRQENLEAMWLRTLHHADFRDQGSNHRHSNEWTIAPEPQPPTENGLCIIWKTSKNLVMFHPTRFLTVQRHAAHVCTFNGFGEGVEYFHLSFYLNQRSYSPFLNFFSCNLIKFDLVHFHNMTGWIIVALSSLFCLIQDLNSAERSTKSCLIQWSIRIVTTSMQCWAVVKLQAVALATFLSSVVVGSLFSVSNNSVA